MEDTAAGEAIPRAFRADPPDFAPYVTRLTGVDPIKLNGKVTQVVGLVIEASGPQASIGDLCEIRSPGRDTPLLTEVVGFRADRTLLMPIGEIAGVTIGSEVVAESHEPRVAVGPDALGRVLDALGRPIDGGSPIAAADTYPLRSAAPKAMERLPIHAPLPLGIRAIDAALTCGKGQRIGIFAGSGVGKSTLLGMAARHSRSDVNVIALVGERGREVREFIENDLGPEGQKRSVVVVATSDEPALVRLKCSFTATAIAEFFRDQGLDVLLMMDSVTRLAMAQREIGLAVGEPPSAKGYTPSVFALLPRLLERAGNNDKGTITGIYTVLVEGDDTNEPISDAVRAILDGHIVLTRDLAHRGHYPPIDILQSVSRVMPQITPAQQQAAARELRRMLAAHRDAADLIAIGAYQAGSNPETDQAIAAMPRIRQFLQQSIDDGTPYDDAIVRLQSVTTHETL